MRTSDKLTKKANMPTQDIVMLAWLMQSNGYQYKNAIHI